MKHFRPKATSVPLPFQMLLVHPLNALSEAHMKDVEDFLGDFGLVFHSRHLQVVDEQSLGNVCRVMGLQVRDFQEFLFGEVLAVILKTKEGVAFPVNAKAVADKADLSKSESVKCLGKLKKALLTPDLAVSDRVAVCLGIPPLARESSYEFDAAYIHLDQINHFLCPADLNHPLIVNRLDILAMYGPCRTSHRVPHCFCDQCSHLLKAALTLPDKSTTPKGNRYLKLLEKELPKFQEKLCTSCSEHSRSHPHIFTGEAAEHMLTHKELNEMVAQRNQEDLLAVLLKVEKNFNPLLVKSWTVEALTPRYTLQHVEEMLAPLDKDRFGRVHFTDLQNLILEDRVIRLNYMAAKILDISEEKVCRVVTPAGFWIKGRMVPANMEAEAKRKEARNGMTGTAVDGLLEKKMASGEWGAIMDRVFHKYSHRVLAIDRHYSDTTKIRMSLMCLKSDGGQI